MKHKLVAVGALREGDVVCTFWNGVEMQGVVSSVHYIRDGKVLVRFDDDMASTHYDDTDKVFVLRVPS